MDNEKNLNYDVEVQLTHLREWILQQPHLNARTEDRWLLIFLRGCKFSLQRTKEKIENFYTIKSSLPDYFSNRDPHLPEIQTILRLGLFLPFPKANSDEPRYFYHRCKNTMEENVSLVNIIKVVLMITDIVFWEDIDMSSAKQYFFCDFEGISMYHVVQITPSIIRNLASFFYNSYPCRPQGIHFANSPSIMESTFNLFKPIIGTKLSDRIHFYSDNSKEVICNNIPHSVLPKDYGGSGLSIDELTVQWKKKVEDYKNWFLEDEQYGCDESKRIKVTDNFHDFGAEGSFRKLSID